jgi:hypothetical protein
LPYSALGTTLPARVKPGFSQSAKVYTHAAQRI